MVYVMNLVESLAYYMATIRLKFVLASTPRSWNDRVFGFFFNQTFLVYEFFMYIIHATDLAHRSVLDLNRTSNIYI
jgi:hypothetical protein